MLLGGDLWFLVRVVLASFTVLFFPLCGLVVRRKWRRSASRKEEIKRLLVLASEETARAELQANHEYGYGEFSYGQVEAEVESEQEPELEPEQEVKQAKKVPAEVEACVTDISSDHDHWRTQNECEACSKPTTTRCARCKRVYYCSGKCQIIHWRQGHKDECHPFGADDQKNNFGEPAHQNPSNSPENGSYRKSIKVRSRHPAKPDETHADGYTFSDTKNVKALDRNDDNEVVHLKDERGQSSILKFVAKTVSEEHSGVISASSKSAVNVSANDADNLSERHQFANNTPDKYENNSAKEDHMKAAVSEDSSPLSSIGRVATFKHNVPKTISRPVNSRHNSSSSSSSGSSVDECNESSFSEPSTSSSGFWEGMNHFIGPRIDVLDDTSHSCSDETCDVDALDSHISRVSHVNKLLSDKVPPAFPGMKESTDELVSSLGMNKYVMKSQKLSFSERSGVADVDDLSRKKIEGLRKTKELGKDAKTDIPPSVMSDKSKCEVESKFSNVKETKSAEVKPVVSKASGVNLCYGNAKRTTEDVKSAKADSIHVVPACKPDRLGQQKDSIDSKSSLWKVVDQLKGSKLSKLNPLGMATESVGRYNDKGLFQYESFVKLYNWNKIELIPCGLMNCGNSCYANVILQCLAFTPPLTAYFVQGLHSHACKSWDWCFLCELEGVVLKAKEGHSPISPTRIISQLQKIGSHLSNGREEDAHEFLRYTIDAMQSICLKGAGRAAKSLEETTLVALTFGGYLRSKIECMRCGGISERQEKMMDLTVEIEGEIGTLEEALRHFTRTETLDGENKYQCGRCKSFERARKKLRVLEAPNILTIALKRFQTGKYGKLNKTIKFPEILNMAPYMSGTSDKSPVYRLYGVVVHLDLMNAAFSGHYVCYVKNFQNRWFKIDDSVVQPVDIERVLTEGAYMLLYARCSPRAPRLLRSSANPRDSRKTKDTEYKSRYPSRDQWDVPGGSSCSGSSRLNCASVQPVQTTREDDSSSDNSSSFFSEVNSCSTDSSTRDSMGTDHFDQMFGDMGAYWNSPWRNSSDSETWSSASSPMYSRHSSHADLDHYAARYSESSMPWTDAAESAVFGKSRHLESHQLEAAEGTGGVSLLRPDSSKHCRNLGSNNSCRESGSRKLGCVNPSDNFKSSVPLRRSTQERLY